MSEGVYRGGDRILRDPQGQLVRVDPAKAEHLLTVGIHGDLFQEVTEREITEYDVAKHQAEIGYDARTLELAAANPGSYLAGQILGYSIIPVVIGIVFLVRHTKRRRSQMAHNTTPEPK